MPIRRRSSPQRARWARSIGSWQGRLGPAPDAFPRGFTWTFLGAGGATGTALAEAYRCRRTKMQPALKFRAGAAPGHVSHCRG